MLKMMSTLLVVNFWWMCHDLFSSYRGEPPMFTGLGEPEKGKSVVR